MSCKSRHGAFSAVIFHRALVFLLLTCLVDGGQPEPVMAMVGDNITLPCHVKPATDAVNAMLEWSRHDLDPRFVHVRRFGEDRLADQNASYKGRTSVSMDKLKQGDMSLKLSNVKLSDEGTYRCFVPGLNKESSVQLTVGAVIEVDTVSSGVLHCKSKGWYPEPEVLWLDGEGNLVSAGPTETVRGPYDLYTVSSRVTVDKRHGNRFTCRVQQKNKSRETGIDVPDDFFTKTSRSWTLTIIICVVVAILIVLVVAFVGWKWRQNTTSKKSHEDEEVLRGGEKKNNASCKASEQEFLIEKESDKGQMENLRKEEAQEKKSKYLNEEHVCQTIKQEKHMRQQETNNSPVQKNGTFEEKSLNVGTGSEVVMDKDRQQDDVQTEGETNNDSDNRDRDTKTKLISEETGSPCSEETGTDTEQEDKTVDTEQSDQGLINGNAQEPQVAEERQEANDHNKKDEEKETQSANDETAGVDATDEKTQQSDVSPGGDMKTVMEQRLSPARADQEHRTDKEHEKSPDSGEKKETNHTTNNTKAQNVMEAESDKSQKEAKKEASSKNSEQGETDGRQMENLKKEGGDKKKSKYLNGEHVCQTEEEIKQEQHMRQKETNNSPVQRNWTFEEKSLNVGTGSEVVMDKDRQQDDVQTEGETNNDSDNRDRDTKTQLVSEETGSPCSEETETDTEQEDKTVDTEQSDQGLINGNAQEPQVAEEGQEANDHNKKDEEKETQSANDETAGVDATDEKTQQSDVSPGGDMKTVMEQRLSPARADREHRTDKEQEKSPDSGEKKETNHTTNNTKAQNVMEAESDKSQKEAKKEASSKNSEQGETEGRQMENLKKEGGDEKKSKYLNGEHVCQTEEEIKQEQHMRQKETNNSPVQRNWTFEEKSLNVGTGSEVVMDKDRQQDDVQTEGETNNDSDNRDRDTKTQLVSEETGSPCSEETETDTEQEDKTVDTEQSDQGLINGNAQEPQVAEEGQEANDLNQ